MNYPKKGAHFDINGIGAKISIDPEFYLMKKTTEAKKVLRQKIKSNEISKPAEHKERTLSLYIRALCFSDGNRQKKQIIIY